MPEPAKSDLQILTEARETITDYKRWTIGAAARDASGKKVSPFCDEAVCFCAQGALQRAVGRDALPSVTWERIGFKMRAELPNDYRHLSSLNDESGHKAVLLLFDKAIAMEMQREHNAGNN